MPGSRLGKRSGWSIGDLVGESQVMRALREEVELVAPLQSTVLLTGETGTGKGMVARIVHALSDLAERPFVHVDCAALAPTVIESELFGHERGAFTSAESRHAGRFELASDGTIFLDEIGDLEPRLQSKLLRILDDREYERIGGTQTLEMRARVVAATSHDLERAVRGGRFRSDLYYRLNVFQLTLPPLRERIGDLPMLAQRAMERLAERMGVPAPAPTGAFLARLARHGWPGNVRELMNVLERLLARRPGGVLLAAHLDAILDGAAAAATGGPAMDPPTRHQDLQRAAAGEPLATLQEIIETSESVERGRIVEALRATGGNVNRAARVLRMARGTLRYRMRKLGVDADAG
jgi:transcriptional regulator with GAF, ATPase, and Fis domain